MYLSKYESQNWSQWFVCLINNSWFILASQPEFPICGDQGALLPPDVGSVPFTWETCSLFSGRQRRVGVPFLYLLLLKQLQLKIVPLWYFGRWPTLSARTSNTSLFILTISKAVLKVWSLICTVQFSSVAQSCQTLCDPMNRSKPGLPVHHKLLEFTQTMSIESVMPSSHLILCHPLLLLPPIPPSIRVFFNESTLLMRWPKYWSFSFSISPSSEHPGLISFRMDWLDLLAVQGTLKSLLQHHSSKRQFFSTQLSSQSDSHIHTWPLEKP